MWMKEKKKEKKVRLVINHRFLPRCCWQKLRYVYEKKLTTKSLSSITGCCQDIVGKYKSKCKTSRWPEGNQDTQEYLPLTGGYSHQYTWTHPELSQTG